MGEEWINAGLSGDGSADRLDSPITGHHHCSLSTPLFSHPFFTTSMSSFIAKPSDNVAIATIRTLAVDVVGKANSGHPGSSFAYLRVFLAFPDANGFVRCTAGHGPSLARPFLPVSSVPRFFKVGPHCPP
jgi:hypothetical protein